MWLIAGLGNPGDDYEDTRHNAGFMVIDILAARHSIQIRQKANNYNFGRGFIGDQKVILIKPFTFMNLSGDAVMAAVRKNEDLEGILIVHDDLDLEPGIVKIKNTGSAGGHNGIQSIIKRLGSRDFPRVKVGVGRPDRMPVERYVLRPFAKKERPLIEEALETAADAVADIINKGIAFTQNKYH